MANRRDGKLYIGVTSNLAGRISQHRSGTGSNFCNRYGLKMLVYAEQHVRIEDAIARQKAVKAWKRAWKLELIEKTNPEWLDLFDRINA